MVMVVLCDPGGGGELNTPRAEVKGVESRVVVTPPTAAQVRRWEGGRVAGRKGGRKEGSEGGRKAEVIAAPQGEGEGGEGGPLTMACPDRPALTCRACVPSGQEHVSEADQAQGPTRGAGAGRRQGPDATPGRYIR